MLNKQAKTILRKIQENADQRRTYYVILDSFSWQSQVPARIAFDMGARDETWSDIKKLDVRYRRFCNYMKEVKPQWKDIQEIPYADNSIEMIQENSNGERRKIMIKSPSGDIC